MRYLGDVVLLENRPGFWRITGYVEQAKRRTYDIMPCDAFGKIDASGQIHSFTEPAPPLEPVV